MESKTDEFVAKAAAILAKEDLPELCRRGQEVMAKFVEASAYAGDSDPIFTYAEMRDMVHLHAAEVAGLIEPLCADALAAREVN